MYVGGRGIDIASVSIISQLDFGNKRLRKPRCNQEWTIQTEWKHWMYKTQEEDKPNTITTHNTEN
jgi:hypothetical protein